MTPQQPKSSAHAYPFVPALMDTALLGALDLTLQAWGMTARARLLAAQQDKDGGQHRVPGRACRPARLDGGSLAGPLRGRV